MKIDPEERASSAMALFREGYNCCQAVSLAFSDIIELRLGMTPDQIRSVTSGFGGGFARMREVCGCVSGMTFVCGAISPALPASHDGGQSSAQESRKRNYALVQECAAAFREQNGSIICRDLLGLRAAAIREQDGPTDIHGFPVESPEPSVRTPEFYKARPCERLIGCAARILAEKIATFAF